MIPDGAVKYIRVVAHPSSGEDPESSFLVGAVTDITERKRAEQEREKLRQLEEDLARINRVSMMGELAASLAHEIKQPIAAAAMNARACLRWLQREPPEIKEARQTMSRIINNVDRAADIIDRNRSLYRRGTRQREPIDLNEIIRQMVVVAARCGEPSFYFNPHPPRRGASKDDSGSCATAAGIDEPHAQWYRGNEG